jgi:GT2 family glycosyltransferase
LTDRASQTKLSIIVVSWNTKPAILDCLRSIGEFPPSVTFEIIVVDNASIDGSVAAIRREFPQVIVLANGENRGFAVANNEGIAQAKGQYLLLLNPDTIVHRGALDSMVYFMDENADVGVCGPLLLNSDGTIQRSVRRFPGFRAALYRNTFLQSAGFFRGQYRTYMMSDFAHDRTMDVDQVMGAAFMTRRSVLDRIGLLDERFFMYYEEVDFCRRAKHTGWRVVFLPQARITHVGGASSDQAPVSIDVMRLTSLIAYFRKHRGILVTAAFNSVFKPAILLHCLLRVVGGVLVYLPAQALSSANAKQRQNRKIRESAVLLGRYSWRLLRS